MNWTKEQLGFILYNNRSVDGVVKNFIPKSINPFKLSKLEKIIKESKSKYETSERFVGVQVDKLNLDCDDIVVTGEDLEKLTPLFLDLAGKFSEMECKYLQMRGINWNSILSEKIFGLSQIKCEKTLEIIGASIHPILSGVLKNDIESGGIVIPLYSSEKLLNCAIRRISVENNKESKTLKYTLAVPDINVWGLSDKKSFWLTEGIFDSLALKSLGYQSVSVSSAAWSSMQILQIIEKDPDEINIFSDSDVIGLKSSFILKDIFENYNISVNVFVSKFAKDASEHIFSKRISMSQIEQVSPENIDLTNYTGDFDIIHHLENRKI